MGAKFTVCCLYYLRHNREEKNSVLRLRTTRTSRQAELLPIDSSDSDADLENLFGQQSLKMGSNQESPGVTVSRSMESPIRQGLDRELQTFINMRDQTDAATEEWEKLNYDIHTLRYARREVRSRWKKILLQLGYQSEAEALLCVNRQSQFCQDQEHLNKATVLLEQLLVHTSLFPPDTGHQSRYLYVMDRLVSLDSAEDFVRLAKEKYPKKAG
ncbi:melanoregulin-like [Antennarius striatus]|uniref:melanoregulin-like n=1 Tax=Antennarius striatus TaxID=241820 RepID=UPI0035B27075